MDSIEWARFTGFLLGAGSMALLCWSMSLVAKKHRRARRLNYDVYKKELEEKAPNLFKRFDVN